MYYLTGAMEVGSQLLLGSDGTFKWILMYGNQDHAAAGTWQVKDKHVVLVSNPRTIQSMAFKTITLKPEAKGMVIVSSDIGLKGVYAKQ